MRTLFIINPLAGGGAGLRVWRRVAQCIGPDREIEAALPTSAARARSLAAEAVAAGYARVIVVGGDGTLATVADALAGTDTTLGAVPAGRGNDFCRNSGISRRLEAALHTARWAQPTRIDLGRVVGGAHFINAAGLGFDGAVAAAAARYPRHLGGTLPYLLGALGTLRWFRPVGVQVTVDGASYSGPAMMVVIANGPGYGGGMQIAPGARRDDGLLDLMLLTGALSRLQILRLLGLVYSGRHIHHPAVRVMRGRFVKVQVERAIGAQLDGEALTTDSLECEAVPGALNVAMPPCEAAVVDPAWATLGQSQAGTKESVLFYDG
jgi:diacylglycerol kinase (ATP)